MMATMPQLGKGNVISHVAASLYSTTLEKRLCICNASINYAPLSPSALFLQGPSALILIAQSTSFTCPCSQVIPTPPLPHTSKSHFTQFTSSSTPLPSSYPQKSLVWLLVV